MQKQKYWSGLGCTERGSFTHEPDDLLRDGAGCFFGDIVLPNAVLLTYPDAGHGPLFQYPESFTKHAAAFLSSDSETAVF